MDFGSKHSNFEHEFSYLFYGFGVRKLEFWARVSISFPWIWAPKTRILNEFSYLFYWFGFQKLEFWTRVSISFLWIKSFVGVNSHTTGPILEGPRGQISYCCIADLGGSGVRRSGDDAACRSDPTFTRASPGLAVATGNSLKLLILLPLHYYYYYYHHHHYYYYTTTLPLSVQLLLVL